MGHKTPFIHSQGQSGSSEKIISVALRHQVEHFHAPPQKKTPFVHISDTNIYILKIEHKSHLLLSNSYFVGPVLLGTLSCVIRALYLNMMKDSGFKFVQDF